MRASGAGLWGDEGHNRQDGGGNCGAIPRICDRQLFGRAGSFAKTLRYLLRPALYFKADRRKAGNFEGKGWRL